jgi:uncharacterized phage protein gp47/JayE
MLQLPGFQIKNFVSIVASMMNRMKATQSTLTDFNIGAVNRTMIEAPAIEIDQLYQQMFRGLLQAIPVATYQTFSFSQLEAIAASGLLTVTIAVQTTDVLIPAGTVFSVQNGVTGYASALDVTIPAGDTTTTVLVAAVSPGAAGNLPPNQSFSSQSGITGFASAVNPSALVSGADAETDDQRLARFNRYIAALARGTVSAIEFGACTAELTDAVGNAIERVAFAKVVEPYLDDPTQPIALVDIYIHNGVGSTTPALVTQCLEVVSGFVDSQGNKVAGWKAAGVPVNVYAATEVSVNLTGSLTASPGVSQASLVPLASAAINNYILALPPAATCVLAEVTALVMAIPGAANFILAPLPAPPPPVLSTLGAGSLPATTYYVQVTYLNANGETIASAEQSLAVPANSILTVPPPPLIAGATGWNVYVSDASGVEQRQNATPMGFHLPWVGPITGLVAGAGVPTANTAALTDATSLPSQKLMPGTTTVI